MNKDSVTKRDFNIPNETDGTHIGIEYGCRYPDGHHEWRTFTDYAGVSLSYESVVNRTSQDSVERWGKTLARRAAAANIQVSEYAESHTFVKRTVILVTTKAEEV